MVFSVKGTEGATSHIASGTLTVTAQQADFSVSATPVVKVVRRGGRATFRIDSASAGGFRGTIHLHAHGLPRGAEARFDPERIGAGGSSTLTVHVSGDTPRGAHVFTVEARSGGRRHSIRLTIVVE